MMNDDIKESIQGMRYHFNWDETDSIESLVAGLIEETYELKDSLKEDEEAFKKELADVLMYALSIVYDMDYNLQDLINQKIEEVMQRDY